MSEKGFTRDQIVDLMKNPNVAHVKGNRITYTDSFKRHFAREYAAGRRPSRIFADAGFDVGMLGTKRIERASARWRHMEIGDNVAGVCIPEAIRGEQNAFQHDAISDQYRPAEGCSGEAHPAEGCSGEAQFAEGSSGEAQFAEGSSGKAQTDSGNTPQSHSSSGNTGSSDSSFVDSDMARRLEQLEKEIAIIKEELRSIKD